MEKDLSCGDRRQQFSPGWPGRQQGRWVLRAAACRVNSVRGTVVCRRLRSLQGARRPCDVSDLRRWSRVGGRSRVIKLPGKGFRTARTQNYEDRSHDACVRVFGGKRSAVKWQKSKKLWEGNSSLASNPASLSGFDASLEGAGGEAKRKTPGGWNGGESRRVELPFPTRKKQTARTLYFS